MSKVHPDDLAIGPAAELVVAADDYAARFSLPDDPHFWIRIELPLEDVVQVSDLTLGQQSVGRVAALLAHALRHLGVARCEGLLVQDIGPAPDMSRAQNLERVGQVIDAYVALERRFIRDRDLPERRGRIGLRVTFDPV